MRYKQNNITRAHTSLFLSHVYIRNVPSERFGILLYFINGCADFLENIPSKLEIANQVSIHEYNGDYDNYLSNKVMQGLSAF